jgi:hypothetical protein
VTEYEAWLYLYEFVDKIPSNGLDNWLNWIDDRSKSTNGNAIDLAIAFSMRID